LIQSFYHKLWKNASVFWDNLEKILFCPATADMEYAEKSFVKHFSTSILPFDGKKHGPSAKKLRMARVFCARQGGNCAVILLSPALLCRLRQEW